MPVRLARGVLHAAVPVTVVLAVEWWWMRRIWREIQW